MATETPDQSASLAEVSRRFITDPAGLPHSRNEGTSRSQTYPNVCGNQPHLWITLIVMEKLFPVSQLMTPEPLARRLLWNDVFIFCYLALHMSRL